MKIRITFVAALLTTSLLVGACGGSSSSTGTGTGGTVSGTVVKGIVRGSSVAAFAITNGTMGAQIGSGTTDASGNFSFSIGDYAGPMMMQASGGTYTDEATGSTMTMQPGDVMAVAIPSVTAGGTTSAIQITPLTSMAHARVHHMTGGITAANITAANTGIGSSFSVGDIVHTAPMDPTLSGSGAGATQDARNYGMAIAAMSQYAKGIGMTSSSGIVTAMMDDASDGAMDGKMGTAAIPMGGGMMAGTMMQPGAGTTGLATAMGAFIASPMNRSGVSASDMQALMNQLATSSGQIPGVAGGTTTGMMSGTAFKGPVSGGTVTAYAVANGMPGAQLGSTSTDAAGGFSVPLGTYAGPVMIQMSGGSYPDEATGSTMPMLGGDVMQLCVPSVTTGETVTGIAVTPLTSMACARARGLTGGMTAGNMTAANGSVGSYFSVSDILHTMPMNPTVAGSGTGATPAARNYGMTIAAMSEYARTIGMTTSSSGMVTTMMNDASDGVMNGMMGSTAIPMTGMGGMMGGMMQPSAGTSGLGTAMSTFIGSAMNRSGVPLSDMQPLIDKLATSSGTLQ